MLKFNIQLFSEHPRVQSGSLTFDGVNTESLGIIVQTPPVYEFPTRKMNTSIVPGRNGDIVIDENAFNNVGREYNLAYAFGLFEESFLEAARKFVDFLANCGGYARLEDTYEPDYYRMAIYRSGGQLPNFYDLATAMVVKFECKPQRFLKNAFP